MAAIPKIVEAAAGSTKPEAAQHLKLFQGIIGPVVMRPVASDDRLRISLLAQ
jgi:hypothetical protein